MGGHAQNCLGIGSLLRKSRKSSFPSAGIPVRKLPSFPWSKTWGVKLKYSNNSNPRIYMVESDTKSWPPFQVVQPSGLPQKHEFLFFCLFPPNTRTRRQPRDHGLLPKQRKETSSFSVHPLWKHKSAIRSYRIFILFIINIVPEAVTSRRKRYERISTYFDN